MSPPSTGLACVPAARLAAETLARALDDGHQGLVYDVESLKNRYDHPTAQRHRDMALVKVKDRAQITLPPDIRKALNVGVGDYLETEVVEGGVLLKPVAVVERTKAWDALFKVLEGVRYQGPDPRPSPEEEERMVAEMIRAYRKERRGNEHA